MAASGAAGREPGASAVVFAYHDVGVRCLSVLLAHGVEVPLVVTHRDDPNETTWFGSVAELAAQHGIRCIAPDDPNAPGVVAQTAALAPDFVFSFYYRLLLKAPLLAIPRKGALNMHGSLLPKYRGRAPVNWAILHGERETGATLHYMTLKPDDGDIVSQAAVAIGPDETGADVVQKVSAAAEQVLARILPQLIDGTAPRRAQDPAQASYFGRRTPEDGRIDWSQPARRIHDLVRAVAPPYPGAFTDVGGRRLSILRTRVLDDEEQHAGGARLVVDPVDARALRAECASGTLEILSFTIDGAPATPADALRAFGPAASLA